MQEPLGSEAPKAAGLHKYGSRAPERARIAGNSRTHLFVWASLTLDCMASWAPSRPPSHADPPSVRSSTDFEEINVFPIFRLDSFKEPTSRSHPIRQGF